MKQLIFCLIIILGITNGCTTFCNRNSFNIKCCSDICIEDIKYDETTNIGKRYKECSPNINIRGSDLSTRISWHGKRINYK